jgi:putative glutamine amidotransferase
MRSKPIIGIPCDRRIYTGQPFHMAGEKYLTAIVHAADAIPLLIPVLEDQIDFDVLLGHLDGILLSGSYSNVEPHHYDGEPSEAGTLHDPYRDAVTLPMIRHVLDMGMPLFAICRGYQELNVALGGTLHQKVHEHLENPDDPIEVRYGPSHPVSLPEGGFLRSLMGKESMLVNSLHSQGVARLADGVTTA